MPLGGISEVEEVQPAPELQETETFESMRIPPFCEVEKRALKGWMSCVKP